MSEMRIGSMINAHGCFTQERFLLVNGHSLKHMEYLLGYRRGRFEKGIYVGLLTQLPRADEFEFGGYNMIPTDKLSADRFRGMNITPQFKEQFIRDNFTLNGPDRLVKVFPVLRHSGEETYPPGPGIPQWMLTKELPFQVIQVITDYSKGKYLRY